MNDELQMPVAIDDSTEVEIERDSGGPLEWIMPTMVASYARLTTREEAESPPAAAGMMEAPPSATLGDEDEIILGPPSRDRWRDVLGEFKERKAAAAPEPAAGFEAGMAAVPGGRNWLPLGPSVVLNGQTGGNQPVGGRVSGLSVLPGGQVIFAATANGGVFRSDDGAMNWRSLMDGFDLDPTSFASASLVSGAIAVDPQDTQRIYVGTGEGDTDQMFRNRITSALPAYRGVGPIVSSDGGETWQSEASDPELAGEAFFALAIDPRDRENVVAATTRGLYQRVPRGGGFEWVRHREGVYSSVVVASHGGTTRFFAAHWGEGVVASEDGADWQSHAAGFPGDDVGRIALAVQPTDPERVVAFIARQGGAVRGLYRLEVGGAWRSVAGLPNVMPGNQGSYDLAVAVDPQDEDVVYLGGDRGTAPPWPASIWRVELREVGGSLTVASSQSIGDRAHADVHVLVHTPGESDELWCGCDGGVFLNRNPRGGGGFGSQNQGLASLCTNFLGQHPTDPNILFTGIQDNGTAHTTGGPAWNHVFGGDGGYCVISAADPRQVLVFANGTIYRSTTGGSSGFRSVWSLPWATMTQPMATPRWDPDHPATGRTVAAAAGRQVLVSDDFAGSWSTGFRVPADAGSVFALAFAGSSRLYAGTTKGRVFRAVRQGDQWSVFRIDDAGDGPLGLVGLITDVAVDWADDRAAYVVFGGQGSAQRVWRFDGSRWESRSGDDPDTSLLDVEHNAIVVDPEAPANLYVGADIGVWHSSDAGRSWEPLQNGLPDAPVFDLQIHPTQRLLRATTHGRGVYEIGID